MKTFFAIIFTSVLASAYTSKDSAINKGICNDRITVMDTFQLDTLIIDGKNERFISGKVKIMSSTEEVLFNQVLLNKTKDTLELDARASDGGAYAAFDKTILPKGTSLISYFLITKDRRGARETFIDLMYKKKGSTDAFKHISVNIFSYKEY